MIVTDPALYVLICTLPLALLGGWLLNVTMLKSLKELIFAQRWQSVSGRIAVSKAIGERQLKGGIIYYPHVKYEYQVGGQSYINNRIYAGGLREGIRHEETVQNNVTKEYPVGKEVQVYYNPANPAESALKKNNPMLALIFLPMAILLDIGLVFYILWMIPQAMEWFK